MFTKILRHWVMPALLATCVTSANASPITYSFSGTLSQPFNGSSLFSGTFTYDTDLPTYPGINPSPGWAYYSGVPNNSSEPPVALTFNVGTTSSSTFGSLASDEVIVAHTSSNDGFYITENFNYANGQNLSAGIGMVNNNLVSPAPFSSTNLPTSLNLANFSMGANLTLTGTLAGGQQVNLIGTITSMAPDAGGGGGGAPPHVPEPSSVLVFLLFGAAGLSAHRRASARRIA